MASVIDEFGRLCGEEDITTLATAPTHTAKQNTPTPTTPPPQTRNSAVSKKKRIRFSNAWDILLLKSLTVVDAHVAPHGESQSRFEESLAIFKSSLPQGALDNVSLPSWKTLNDRYKKIVSDHREAVKTNATASGIVEVRGERETLLDDVVLAVDEFEESKRTERDERTELDKRLREAGEEIRSQAMRRGRQKSSNSDRADDTPRSETRKRSLISESDDEDRNMINDHISARKDIEEKRMKIEERRLQFDVERVERETLRLEKGQDNDARRIAVEEKRIELEERRLALDSEERKGAIAERKEKLAVLGALVKKLG